ncbi:MAG: protein-export chaperone SecB [Alphaproteobacteria bacterium]|nr:protein-export chaperone SecB [Alphaproteobacteria bacterium]
MENTKDKQTQNQGIIIHNQYIKDLSLEIPHAPKIFKSIDTQPQIKIDVNIGAEPIEGNTFEVSLTFRIDGDVKSEKFFILEMTYAGIITVNVPDKHKEPVLMIEAPHLLFPYARQAISSALFNGGLPPLMLNPVDFAGMFNARKQAEQNSNK